MKALTTLSALTLLLVQALVSCRPGGADTRLDSNNELIRQRAAEEYLQSLLQAGESVTNLVSKFGRPAFQSETPSKELCLTFYLPQGGNAANTAGISAFDAFFVSNRLSRWLPIYVRAPTNR